MRLAAGPPTHWVVVLQDGSRVDVWADAVTGLAGPDDGRDYEFGSLMDIEVDAQADFVVSARAPSDPRRVEVLVARFPRSSVAYVTSP